MDYFLLDIKEKTFRLVDDSIEDSFIDTIPKIEKIRIAQKSKSYKFIKLRRFDLELKVFVKDLIILQDS